MRRDGGGGTARRRYFVAERVLAACFDAECFFVAECFDAACFFDAECFFVTACLVPVFLVAVSLVTAEAT
jgi:hypothetical protein